MTGRDGMAMDVRVGETVTIVVPTSDGPEMVAITLERKDGRVARMRINAPKSVRITKPTKEFCASELTTAKLMEHF